MVLDGYFRFLVVFGGSLWFLVIFVVLGDSQRATKNYQEPKKHRVFGVFSSS